MIETCNQVPEAMPVGIKDLLGRWHELTRLIREWKDSEFPIGAVVYVDCAQYKGHGIVSADRDCRDDRLPVRLQNGNVWWYPVEACTRIKDMKALPRYARRMKLEFHGVFGMKAA